MSTTVYRGGTVIRIPECHVEYYKSRGFTTEAPGSKKSRKPPTTEEGSTDGEDKGQRRDNPSRG